MNVEFEQVTTTYEKLPIGYRARVEAKLVAVNKRLAKLGAPVAVVEFGPIVEREVRDEETGWKHTVREFETVTLTGVEAKLGGWTAIASLDHTVSPDQAWVTKFPGHHDDEIANGFVLRGSVCDHCNIAIRRNLTVLFRHDDGRWAQVGTSCVLDYIGVDPTTVLWLASIAVECDDPDAGGGYNSKRDATVSEFLAAAAEATRINGFVPSQSIDGWATKAQALQIVDGKLTHSKTGLPIWPGLDFAQGQLAAAKVIDWVLTSVDTSEFMCSARVAVNAKLIHGRTVGLLAALPYSYGKAMERQVVKVAEEVIPSEFIGNVGEKLTVTGKVIVVRTFDGTYGSKRLVVVRTAEGNQVSTIGTGNSIWDCAEGDAVEMKGQIKDHEEKGYGKRTVLTMAKIAALVSA